MSVRRMCLCVRGRGESGEVLGQFEAAGIRPKFATLLRDRGIELDPAVFNPQTDLTTP